MVKNINSFKVVAPILAAAAAGGVHALFFHLRGPRCDGGYFAGGEYFVGVSYALTAAFIAFAFIQFRNDRRASLKAAVGGGGWAVLLWTLCFFTGCCGSPMLWVYVNLLGLAGLKIPKWGLLAVTAFFLSVGFLWMERRRRPTAGATRP